MSKKKKKEKPVLSKAEKDAEKALKKKNQKEANRRKRVGEAIEDEEEALLANPSPTASTSKKRKQESSRSAASTSKKRKTTSNESPTSKAEKKRAKKLKKLNKLRKPVVLTREEQRRINRLRRRKIIVWWDYENLPYPKVGAFEMIEKKLRREGYTGEIELHAIVGYKGDPQPIEDKSFTMHYGDLKPRPKEGTKADQKADNHMKKLIQKFVKDNKGALQNTLLITNDNRFREDIDSLRAAGHCVLLATSQKSLIIKSASHRVWFWNVEIVQED